MRTKHFKQMNKLKVHCVISVYLPKTDWLSKPNIDKRGLFIAFSSDRYPTPLWNALFCSNISSLQTGWYYERMAPYHDIAISIYFYAASKIV